VRRRASLLRDVRELVRDQPHPLARAWVVGPTPEEDVAAGCERPRLERAAERVGAGVGVHANVGKIGSEYGLGAGPRGFRERLASAARAFDRVLEGGNYLALPADRHLRRSRPRNRARRPVTGGVRRARGFGVSIPNGALSADAGSVQGAMTLGWHLAGV